MTDLLLEPAAALLEKLRARSLSSRELIELTLARIASLNPKINAFCAVDEAAARQAANEADRRLKQGEARPLEGLPIGIKDVFDAVGLFADFIQ